MKIKKRLQEDYFKKSRLPDYYKVISAFYDAGYRMMGVLDFYNLVSNNKNIGKVFVNRHDIDTSPRVARKMFEIEKKVYGHEGSATYYFRDSTIDKKLISEIDAYGYETGYHYEELATFEKKSKLKDVSKIRESLPQCRTLFIKDIERFRSTTNSPSLTVASHGDFINTKYKIQNAEVLADSEIRKKAGIIVEAYDDVVNCPIQARFADQILLEKFPNEVIKGIDSGFNIIMTLTHPRNWETDVIANTKDNVCRFWQGIIYNL